MQRNRASDRSVRRSAIDPGSSLAVAGRLSRRRLDIDSSSPALQVRRLLFLVARFHELCAQGADPVRLCDLLRRLILCGRGTFVGEPGMPAAREWGGRANAEQAKCLEELELLMHAMMQGVPGASRGLIHALDGLLVQCVILEARATTRDGRSTRSRA